MQSRGMPKHCPARRRRPQIPILQVGHVDFFFGAAVLLATTCSTRVHRACRFVCVCLCPHPLLASMQTSTTGIHGCRYLWCLWFPFCSGSCHEKDIKDYNRGRHKSQVASLDLADIPFHPYPVGAGNVGEKISRSHISHHTHRHHDHTSRGQHGGGEGSRLNGGHHRQNGSLSVRQVTMGGEEHIGGHRHTHARGRGPSSMHMQGLMSHTATYPNRTAVADSALRYDRVRRGSSASACAGVLAYP